MAAIPKQPQKFHTYNEMLDLYMDKNLTWQHAGHHYIHNITDSDLDYIIEDCQSKQPDDNHFGAKAKHWLIILNLEKDSRNAS